MWHSICSLSRAGIQCIRLYSGNAFKTDSTGSSRWRGKNTVPEVCVPTELTGHIQWCLYPSFAELTIHHAVQTLLTWSDANSFQVPINDHSENVFLYLNDIAWWLKELNFRSVHFSQMLKFTSKYISNAMSIRSFVSVWSSHTLVCLLLLLIGDHV